MLDPTWCPHLRIGTLYATLPDTDDVEVFCYDCNTIQRVTQAQYKHRSTMAHLQWCYDVKRVYLTPENV